uniref:Uncharacterized protein n=1 Tax=Stomoxys calcitrans TaxID=35570 RepID=A0A1I8PVI5_STOCA
MKLINLLLCVAFLAGIAAVRGKTTNGDDQETKTSASVEVIKPTEAPLMTSTQAPPTKAPKVAVTPTKSPAPKASAKSAGNGTRKTSSKSSSTATEKKTEAKPTEKTTKAAEAMEAKPVEMPATEKVAQKKEASTQVKGKDMKPLAVTGFITENGNIYEIDDKTGMGKIEGRQNPPEDTEEEHICNYGSVVIYSDVPCDEVTNIEITGHKGPLSTTSKPTTAKPEPDTATQGGAENKDKDKENEDEDSSEVKPVRHRPNSKRPRNKNRRQQNGVRRGNNRRRGNRRRQGQSQRRSQQEMMQRRRRQQQRRRRGQLADGGYRRQGQNQRRRNQGGNRRQQTYFGDFEEDDYNRGRSIK